MRGSDCSSSVEILVSIETRRCSHTAALCFLVLISSSAPLGFSIVIGVSGTPISVLRTGSVVRKIAITRNVRPILTGRSPAQVLTQRRLSANRTTSMKLSRKSRHVTRTLFMAASLYRNRIGTEFPIIDRNNLSLVVLYEKTYLAFDGFIFR